MIMMWPHTCKFNNDQQGLTPRLSANAKKVDDVYMTPYLLHYLHLLIIKWCDNNSDGDDNYDGVVHNDGQDDDDDNYKDD